MGDLIHKLTDTPVMIALVIAFLLGFSLRGGGRNGLSPTPPTPEEIEERVGKVTRSKWLEIDAALDQKNRIQAIRLLREATGLGLKDSKEAIDARMKKRDLRPH